MGRPRKIQNGEVAVVQREQGGIKISSIGVTYGRKVGLANYSSANAECSIWADFSDEQDDRLDQWIDQLQQQVRQHVEREINADLAEGAPDPSPKHTAAPPARAGEPPRRKETAPTPAPAVTTQVVADHHGTVPPPPDPLRTGTTPPPPAQQQPAAVVGTAGLEGGRALTTAIIMNGKTLMTGGVLGETLVDLFDACPAFEKATGLSAKDEMRDFVKDPTVLTRKHLDQRTAEAFLAHLRAVTEAVLARTRK